MTPAQFQRNEVRKARKAHKCHECQQVIERGQTYEYSAGMGEDGFWSCRLCLVCRDVWAAVWGQSKRFCMDFGDGVAVGWLLEHLLEMDVVRRDDNYKDIGLNPEFSDVLTYSPLRPHLPVVAHCEAPQ